MTKRRISVDQAAERLGVSPQFIRVALQQNKLPIGVAIQISGNRYTYHISPKLLDDYAGKEG